MTKKDKFIGLVFASLTVFIWGITFVSTKYLLRSYSPFEILILRFIMAYCALWVLHPKKLVLSQRKNELYFALAGLSGVTAYQFMENMAISYTSASNVSIIVSICPIFAAIFTQVFLKEKHLTVYFNIGFILAIIGIALVSFNGVVEFHLNPKGDVLAFGSALCWGFYSLFVSKINALGLESIQTTRRIFYWALIFMLPIGIFSILKYGPAVPQISGSFDLESAGNISLVLDREFNLNRFSNPINWLNLCFLGLGASAFCFAAWSIACEKLGTVRATVGIYLIPVVTIIFAFFILGEKISTMGAIGAALTITGLFVSEIRS